jgi:hypothetical protein
MQKDDIILHNTTSSGTWVGSMAPAEVYYIFFLNLKATVQLTEITVAIEMLPEHGKWVTV